jgi:hypothetical protein
MQNDKGVIGYAKGLGIDKERVEYADKVFLLYAKDSNIIEEDLNSLFCRC